MRRILCLETTCDETAAAVLDADLNVLGEVVASQAELHRKFHGVVPEIAARAHLERVLPVISEVLKSAQVTLDQLDAIAVAHTPGLAGSIIVGLMAAKALCLATGKPLIGINHLHAHIYACHIASGKEIFPCIGLIVSGGHSNFYRCEGPTDFKYLGGTIDDAAGEAFDKVASLLGLPYPGGPQISRCAERGDRKRFPLPRPLLDQKDRLDFSFSGLKTAVRYQLVGPGKQDITQLEIEEGLRNDLAASFEEAVVDCLVGKSLLAVRQTEINRLCVGGGVAANRRFRERLAEACQKADVELHIAPMNLCTDNAVMGGIAFEKLSRGQFDSLDLDIRPGLDRGDMNSNAI
ncbi:MAG TPA: tRNA (adenosine(37)-N6)-threonylcarbamoyltransferase complex transferase subunit TsaD [Planctomycetaceae bacterium]|nr:tRNA (adenosine(37)-N6)-threonylcarbamoyltransferase complex transferase subunit TsaD [Planctomycetaceae bacterium]